MMKINHMLALLLALSIAAVAQNIVKTAPRADDRFRADVLLVVAHPDDETGVSAYLVQLLDQGKKVAAVYMTRGEAGHNNMGPERGISLGAAREMELRHALSQLGIQNVWFLDGRDTPTQDVRQSLASWHHGACLEDLVRIIRLTRPNVVITWLPAFFIGENHGDHQAAGVVAIEAFDSAGDPAVFPAQLAPARHINETLLEGLEPWQPQKLYFFSDASDEKQFKGKGPEYPATAISPTRHVPYWRVAMDEFRYHRTQYRSYIEKLDAMNDEQLAKLAGADQDGWDNPVGLIFGKSNVPGSVTGDVFEGVSTAPIAFVRPPTPAPEQHSGVSMTLGGPWIFYERFRRAHDLMSTPQAQSPEIAISAGSTLQLPLVLRNDSSQSVELSLSLTVPEGWIQPEKSQRYQLSAGEVFPVQLELIAPPKRSEQINEVMCRATSAADTIGTVTLRVRVGTGGLPQ
jgi:LmbE family N-acetylglucosaminyl deacetylase